MNENEVLQALGTMLAQKASGTPSTTAYPYVAGGLFGRCDGPATLVNALVDPIGFEANMTWVGNNTENEFVDAWTGISETGDEQSTACGDCITTLEHACVQLYCFGRFCRQTKELQFDRLGLKANANVPVKTLFGSITAADGTVIVPQGAQVTDGFFLETRKVGYATRYKNSVMLWTGNPVNNSGTAYQEYQGFQLIVNTGKFDHYTQAYCDALDSFLMNFAYQSPASDGAYAIGTWLRRPIQQFMRRAGGAGLDWATSQMYIVMNPNLWDCVARAYACAGLDLCSSSGTNNSVSASADQARDRYEQYLSAMSLPILGRNYPVVLDSQIPQTTGQANGICSDIYFMTTSIAGQEVLYGEYQDFNQTYGRVRNEMLSMFNSDDIYITDNGRFALVRHNVGGCFDVQMFTKPRVIAMTPWLLGRIQNCCCSMLSEPLPDSSISGGVYYVDGGRSAPMAIPTLYGPC